MPGATTIVPLTCSRCLWVTRFLAWRSNRLQLYSTASPHPRKSTNNGDHASKFPPIGNRPSEGAMSQRLGLMTEEALETGGRRARKAIEEAGISEELRLKLEERIASATFKQQNASALAQASLPSSAGQGTRNIAGAQPWTGTEAVEDTALRMLTDAHKPLRGVTPKVPLPTRIDTGRTRSAQSSGTRLANARDRSSVYNLMKDSQMDEKEKEAYRREMKERFSPAGRSAPITLSGLESLANERIEDAIARGQFKNLPRGKKIERDYNMSSPFIDTTQYFMNKIIQKQDLVPPWIEKQQELVSTATKFRARLRNDWKRHASRLIASRGGTLEAQVEKARAYARAEAIDNPPRKRMLLSAVDGADTGTSQITSAGELRILPVDIGPEGNANANAQWNENDASAPPEPLPAPFRDPQWEKNENSFLSLTITTLNSMTRSYNLMAPDLAKKPYFKLERELRACYADVAPQLADAIRASAMAPKKSSHDAQSGLGRRANQLLERFAGESTAAYRLRAEEEGERYDGTKPYGFKQFWRDLWAPPR